MSTLTLATIKPVISDPAFQQLTKSFADKDLEELSSPDGRTLAKEHNAQMGWHTDNAGAVDGVFLRMFTGDSLQLYTWLKSGSLQKPYDWTTTSRYVSPSKALTIPRVFANFAPKSTALLGSDTFEALPTRLTVIEAPEEPLSSIPRPEMPTTLARDPLDTETERSPSSPDRSNPPLPTRRKYNFTRIGVSIILTLTVLYAVKKLFVKPAPKPPQIIPPIQPKGHSAFSKTIAT